MKDVDTYREQLQNMRARIVRQLGSEWESIQDSINKPGEQTHLHTHNADMDVEGLDEAVGVSHALQKHIHTINHFLNRLDTAPDALLADEREREHLDALLETNELRNGQSE